VALFLITVKLPRDPDHDPTNRKAGTCPVNHGNCTDITGPHHTFLLEADGNQTEMMEEVRTRWPHVTRIEEVILHDGRSD
jgi:hypothetical protein